MNNARRGQESTEEKAIRLTRETLERLARLSNPVVRPDQTRVIPDPLIQRLAGVQMTGTNLGRNTRPISFGVRRMPTESVDSVRAPERVINEIPQKEIEVVIKELVEELEEKPIQKTRLDELYEEAIAKARALAISSTPAPKPAPPKPAPPAAKPAAERPSTPAPPAPKPAAPAAPAVPKTAAPAVVKTAAPAVVKTAAPAASKTAVPKPAASKTAAPKTAAPKPAAPAVPKPAAPKLAAARKSATSRSKSIPAGRPSTPPAPMPPKPKSPTKPRPTKAERDAKAGAAALAGAHAAVAAGRITRHRSATPPKTRTVKSPARPANKPTEVYAVREGGKLHETVQKYLKRADGTYRKLGERQSINDFKGKTHLLNHGDPATWDKPFPTDKVV